VKIPWLDHDDAFPDVEQALNETDGAAGLLAAGADLSPQRLLDAYRQGIFPWFSDGQPILWWSTDPRMVLRTDHFVVSDSLKKTLRKVGRDSRWEIRFDSAFEQVMRACAAPRADGPGTWISEEIVAGYCGLHRLGYAPFVRSLARWGLGRGRVRSEHRAHVLRRIDVCARHRCV
jgi:leucyl/phenylalanyl-tRNA--protein transferase